MSFTQYMERNLLDHVFGAAPYSPPGTLYVGLSKTAISDHGAGVEEPDGAAGYARASFANDLSSWGVAVTGGDGNTTKSNAIDIAFPEPGASWGTVTHFFITDGTHMLGYGDLQPPKDIVQGDVVVFRPGELIITLE